MDAEGLNGATVVLMGAFDYSYPREKTLHDGFEHAGSTVLECRYGDSTQFLSPKKVILLPYLYFVLIRGMWAIRKDAGDIDILFVTKFDPLVLPLAAIYAWVLDARLVYDLFVSLHRTAEMRGVSWSLVKATYVVERLTYRLPDHHLVGTNQFIELYAEMYHLPQSAFVRFPPGADEDRFYPREVPKRQTFTALYWGNFLPHHGVDVILDAAVELQDEDIQFVMLGTGPERAAAEERKTNHGLANVSFEGYVEEPELQRWIASSHVTLGVFSDDPRALASITNKVCESVASGKATVTEDSPAIRERFTNREDIYTVPPEDGTALAEGVLELRNDSSLVEQLEAGALAAHEREFSTSRLADLLEAAFAEGGNPNSRAKGDD